MVVVQVVDHRLHEHHQMFWDDSIDDVEATGDRWLIRARHEGVVETTAIFADAARKSGTDTHSFLP